MLVIYQWENDLFSLIEMSFFLLFVYYYEYQVTIVSTLPGALTFPGADTFLTMHCRYHTYYNRVSHRIHLTSTTHLTTNGKRSLGYFGWFSLPTPIDVTYQHLGVTYQHLGVTYQDLGVTYQHVSVTKFRGNINNM